MTMTATRARGRLRRAVVWTGACACLLSSALGAPEAAAPDAARPRRTSTRDSPGWYPTVDPESMSVVVGRRLNAPLVSARFHGGARSLDELGRAVCRALHHQDRDSLHALCIDADEFREILWREFPQSRPATGLTWEDAWMILNARLGSGSGGAIGDNGGRYLEFLRFERPASAVTRYRNFKLHNGLVLVVRNDQGGVERLNWIRSVAERRGRFKIYSTDD